MAGKIKNCDRGRAKNARQHTAVFRDVSSSVLPDSEPGLEFLSTPCDVMGETSLSSPRSLVGFHC